MSQSPAGSPAGAATPVAAARPGVPVTLPAETLGVLSLRHLTADTQRRLAHDLLSVNAYPMSCGGLVYVGRPPDRRPAEADLAALFDLAQASGVAWLMFDRDVPVTGGLPVHTEPGPLD